MDPLIVLLLVVVASVALAIGFFLHKQSSEKKIGSAEAQARRIIEAAQRDAETSRKAGELEAREAMLKGRGELEQEARRQERELKQTEQRVLAKDEELSKKLSQTDRRASELIDRERGLVAREQGIAEKEGRLAHALEDQRRKLETISGLTAEEARRQLLGTMEEEARREAALVGMRLEEQARETAREKAREVLATTIQRLAPDYTVETAVSVVDLPSDDMKGRIIGREGRNIRALEQATGVDLIVDDTPEAVLISAYDPYRREIARLALQRLIRDGRLHPARIEEVGNLVKQELDVTL